MPTQPHISQTGRGVMLITAGPTHEPIDAVRYLGNRSSGRLGIELARHAAANGWTVTLLLGPTSLECEDSRVSLRRFRTTADLQALLATEAPRCDVLVMAAAVADYRPFPREQATDGGVFDPSKEKLRRREGGLTLELAPTPDLLSACAAARVPGQTIVGFALEPRDRMIASAREKLDRKRVDMIVANPLETMDSGAIEAVLIRRGAPDESTPGQMDKADFAAWLLIRIESARSTGVASI